MAALRHKLVFDRLGGLFKTMGSPDDRRQRAQTVHNSPLKSPCEKRENVVAIESGSYYRITVHSQLLVHLFNSIGLSMSHSQSEILNRLQERFGESLQSVVLFGSQARGTGNGFSDIDLLIVLKDAPRELRGRRQLASSIRRQLGLPIDSTILRTDAFVYSVRYLAPLMIELARDYEIWYDREGFFSGHIAFIRALMDQGKLFEMQAGVWKLTEKIDEMARDGVGVSARSSF